MHIPNITLYITLLCYTILYTVYNIYMIMYIFSVCVFRKRCHLSSTGMIHRGAHHDGSPFSLQVLQHFCPLAGHVAGILHVHHLAVHLATA